MCPEACFSSCPVLPGKPPACQGPWHPLSPFIYACCHFCLEEVMGWLSPGSVFWAEGIRTTGILIFPSLQSAFAPVILLNWSSKPSRLVYSHFLKRKLRLRQTGCVILPRSQKLKVVRIHQACLHTLHKTALDFLSTPVWGPRGGILVRWFTSLSRHFHLPLPVQLGSKVLGSSALEKITLGFWPQPSWRT